jgi:hypothetical protein
MQIEQLISHLQAIAAKYPNSIVYVEDGMDPSDPCPITNIEHNKGCSTGTAEIYLSSGFYDEQPFNIDEF